MHQRFVITGKQFGVNITGRERYKLGCYSKTSFWSLFTSIKITQKSYKYSYQLPVTFCVVLLCSSRYFHLEFFSRTKSFDSLASGNPFWNLLNFGFGQGINQIKLDHSASHGPSPYRRNNANNDVFITTRSAHVNTRAWDAFESITAVKDHVIRFSLHAASREPQRIVRLVAMETRKLNSWSREKAATADWHGLPVMSPNKLQNCKIVSKSVLLWGLLFPFPGNVLPLHANPVKPSRVLKKTCEVNKTIRT